MRTLFLAAVALVATAADAQTRIGLGAQLGGFGGLFGPASILVPIDINEVIRVEPSVGFFSQSASGTSFTATSRQTTLGLGIGAIVPSPGVTLTAGARGSYTRLSFTDSVSGSPNDEGTQTVVAIGPAVTGEYPFSNRFRLGVDLGLEYRSVSGDEDGSIIGRPSTDGFQTTASLSARFFF